jgi:predicted NAD/FAD-dependent oxidoreductase
LVAFVVSGASDWLGRGLPALAAAVQRQAASQLPASFADPPEVVHTAMERRATFVCRPSLARPSSVIASGVWAAGDYVDGPYPATIEGAVRSGVQAARAILAT